jgi:hypothetical protein
MAKFTFPKEQIKADGILRDLSIDLIQLANPVITQNNGHVIYEVLQPDLVYDLFTHENVILLMENGGEIEDYIMYAECQPNIYNQEVPDGLSYRTIKITDGTTRTTTIKNFSQWASYKLTQTFRNDNSLLYVTTTPLDVAATGTELKLMVDGFGVKLLTIKEYNLLKESGDIIE